MSTNMGEEGLCKYCGHAKSGHTAAHYSKCGNCKKRYYICQGGGHGSNQNGWVMCNTCDCKPKYRPDITKVCKELEVSAYADTHPALQGSKKSRARKPTAEARRALLGKSTSSQSAVPEEWVDVIERYVHSGIEYVAVRRNSTGEPEYIPVESWEIVYWELEDDTTKKYFRYEDRDTPRTLWTESLGEDSGATSDTQGGKGKGHIRSWSQESGDPLTEYDEGGDSITSQLAAITLDEENAPWQADDLGPGGAEASGSGSTRLNVAVVRDSKGKVCFTNPNTGDYVMTDVKRWTKVRGGYLYSSKKQQVDFFTSILPKKK